MKMLFSAISSLILIGLLSGCQKEQQVNSSVDVSEPVQVEVQTTASQSEAVDAKYRGEMAEIEVATDDMLQLMAWMESPTQLSFAVHMNRLAGSVDLTSATKGVASIAGQPTAKQLVLSNSKEVLTLDLAEPVIFPVVTTVTLDIGADLKKTMEQQFTIKGIASQSPLKD
jgi:hypothetical protein